MSDAANRSERTEPALADEIGITELDIEALIIGRNDNYEPGWNDRLVASIAYNHARFAEQGLRYGVAFIEWNPPRDAPLLAPGLVQRFPYVRAVIVDPDVHAQRCESPDLTVLLNFAFNAGLRTSAARFTIIASGDTFYARTLVERLRADGPRQGVLYRAERVNVAAFDLDDLTPSTVEDPSRITHVETCTEPPYDQPPYTNACGDFLLTDRATMTGLRGFDESIRGARIHLDSRFAWTAMTVLDECVLLGRIFHIDHARSWLRSGTTYPGRPYVPQDRIPYLNDDDWGLGACVWGALGDRLLTVSDTPGYLGSAPLDSVPERTEQRTQAVIAPVRSALQHKAAERDQSVADILVRIASDPADRSPLRELAEHSQSRLITMAEERAGAAFALSLAAGAVHELGDRLAIGEQACRLAATSGSLEDAVRWAGWCQRAGFVHLNPLAVVAADAQRSPLERLEHAALECRYLPSDASRARLIDVTGAVGDAELIDALLIVGNNAPDELGSFLEAAATSERRCDALASVIYAPPS